MVGRTLGPYEVVAKLGEGGMGEVYQARDTRLDRTVAIKILSAQVAGDRESRQRFEREAKTLASLSHPHICPVFDLGNQDGIDYLVMEYLAGETLAARLTRGALPPDEVIDVALQIADALDTAHAKGIVHRDLKPGNVMMTKNGARLLDFGLAKRRVDLEPVDPSMPTAMSPVHRTSPGVVLGTVAYMAPEQARGGEADARADLFAFGAVLHEMATGAVPFPGTTTAVVFDAIFNRPPAALDRLPPALAGIVGRALEKAPELRYQSAADMRSDLLRVKRDGSAARPISVADATRPAITRQGIDSLAVLPLSSAGGDADSEYLGEGIAESLINSLAEMGRLRIAPAHKSFRYGAADVDLQRVARDLNVQAVVMGRVVARGDTLVVRLRLVDVEKDAQLWGQQFTAKMADIFTLEHDIADQVLHALEAKLRSGARPAMVARADTEVYHLYLKGRYYAAKRTPPNTQRALEYYKQVLDLDPTYAAAYAGVADCYAHLGFTPYSTMKPADAYPRAKAAAHKALALDPSLGDAHASLGMCALYYDWDWTAADLAFQRCLALSPDSLGARVQYPFLLSVGGRHDQAIAEAHRAIAVDPLSVNAATVLGQVYYLARDYDAATRALAKALEIDPDYVTAIAFLGFVHVARGEYEEGIAALSRAGALAPHHSMLGLLAQACGLAGRTAEAENLLAQLTAMARTSYVSPHSFALVYAGLGRMDDWREAISAALEERSGLLIYVNHAAWLDPVREHPFFEEIRRQVGLAEPGLASLQSRPQP